VLTVEFGRFTHVFKLVGGPDSIEGKGRTAFLPAVGAVVDADAKGFTERKSAPARKGIFPKAPSWLIPILSDVHRR
jgi:hypothetical protein